MPPSFMAYLGAVEEMFKNIPFEEDLSRIP
jgi:hypothetical protein